MCARAQCAEDCKHVVLSSTRKYNKRRDPLKAVKYSRKAKRPRIIRDWPFNKRQLSPADNSWQALEIGTQSDKGDDASSDGPLASRGEVVKRGESSNAD